MMAFHPNRIPAELLQTFPVARTLLDRLVAMPWRTRIGTFPDYRRRQWRPQNRVFPLTKASVAEWDALACVRFMVWYGNEMGIEADDDLAVMHVKIIDFPIGN
eukprot:Opistho-2@90165